MEVQCAHCYKFFSIDDFKDDPNEQHFCSTECSIEWLTKEYNGKNCIPGTYFEPPKLEKKKRGRSKKRKK
jgi:hypothetical protein